MGLQRVILRADGSGKTGYGHFIRSLALASYLKNDFECHFSTYNSVEHQPTSYQLSEISKVCDYLPITGSDLEEASADFLRLLQPGDIVVLDNYYYTTQYQQTIKDKDCKLVCIDDMHDRHMVCDLLLTACPLQKEDFSMDRDTKFIGGIEWAFLREPFLSRKKRMRDTSEKVTKVVIAMGGADPYHLTDKMVQIARRVLPDAEIHVMAGDTVEISGEISRRATIHRRIDAEEIAELFDLSDLGIFPASTVCMEAFSRSLPVAAGYYVNNQEDFYRYGVEKGLFGALGNLLDDSSAIEARLKEIVGGSGPASADIDFREQRGKIIRLFKELL